MRKLSVIILLIFSFTIVNVRIIFAQNNPVDEAIKAAEKLHEELLEQGRLQAELRDRFGRMSPNDPEWQRFLEIDYEAKNTIDKLRVNKAKWQELQHLKKLSPEARISYVKRMRKLYPTGINDDVYNALLKKPTSIIKSGTRFFGQPTAPGLIGAIGTGLNIGFIVTLPLQYQEFRASAPLTSQTAQEVLKKEDFLRIIYYCYEYKLEHGNDTKPPGFENNPICTRGLISLRGLKDRQEQEYKKLLDQWMKEISDNVPKVENRDFADKIYNFFFWK